MAGIHHHRKMGQLVQRRNGGDVQCVPGIRFKGADAPLTENDVLVSARHDVFRTHQQFLQRVGQSPLQENRLPGLSQRLQQFEILHIPGPHLNHIHLFEQREVVLIHDFRHDGKTGGFLCLHQQFDAVGFHSLKRIGRSPGFEGTAPQHGGTGGLHPFGNSNNLLFGFHGARSGDHGKISSADFRPVHIHNGILWMKQAVGFLVRCGNFSHVLHHVQHLHHAHVHHGRIPDQPQQFMVVLFRYVDLQSPSGQPAHQLIFLFFLCVRLQCDNHSYPP